MTCSRLCLLLVEKPFLSSCAYNYARYSFQPSPAEAMLFGADVGRRPVRKSHRKVDTRTPPVGERPSLAT